MKRTFKYVLKAGAAITGFAVFAPLAFAYTPYTWTNAVSPAPSASNAPRPTCLVDKTNAASNEKVIFTPVSPSNAPAAKFMWKGEVSTTTTGKIAIAFIYPGAYTVVLRAIAFDGSYVEVQCPKVNVNFDAVPTSTSTLPPAYIFPFATTTTKALIPKELTPISKDCLNFGQDISFGYSDDVEVPSQGVIYILQSFLAREGYLRSEPTGYFGSMTLSAVKAFQSFHGLPPTGYVGPMTRGAIKSQTCLG